MAVSTDFLSAVAGANGAVLIAVAVDWSNAVKAAKGRFNKREGRKAAGAATGFAAVGVFYALIALLAEWDTEDYASWWVGGVLLLLTFGSLTSLCFLFFPTVTARANRRLGNDDARC